MSGKLYRFDGLKQSPPCLCFVSLVLVRRLWLRATAELQSGRRPEGDWTEDAHARGAVLFAQLGLEVGAAWPADGGRAKFRRAVGAILFEQDGASCADGRLECGRGR